jgi:hypothetical protein
MRAASRRRASPLAQVDRLRRHHQFQAGDEGEASMARVFATTRGAMVA